MSEPIEPIRHKLAEAVSPAPDLQEATGGPADPQSGAPGPLHGVDEKQHNADVHPDHRERLVDIGRAQDTKGRGSQKGGS